MSLWVQPTAYEHLNNLIKERRLKEGALAETGIARLISNGKACLEDARNKELKEETRFDLARAAACALSLAARQITGCRPNGNRYVVFECLKHTSGISGEDVRISDDAHRIRDLVEYEGGAEFDEQIIPPPTLTVFA